MYVIYINTSLVHLHLPHLSIPPPFLLSIVLKSNSIQSNPIKGMTKVHPNAASTTAAASNTYASDGKAAAILTVWKKSLLFNCNGFTVFDCNGNLVFRVDNYVAGNRGEIVLMDAAGKPLLTIRRKRLSLGDNWLVFDGETAINPLLTAKKHVNLLNSKLLAHVSSHGGNESGLSPNRNVMYEIEGSYLQRSCVVYDNKTRKVVAEIKRKEAVGLDVFRLIVQPEIDPPVAMALVILLDQMFGSSKSLFSP